MITTITQASPTGRTYQASQDGSTMHCIGVVLANGWSGEVVAKTPDRWKIGQQVDAVQNGVTPRGVTKIKLSLPQHATGAADPTAAAAPPPQQQQHAPATPRPPADPRAAGMRTGCAANIAASWICHGVKGAKTGQHVGLAEFPALVRWVVGVLEAVEAGQPLPASAAPVAQAAPPQPPPPPPPPVTQELPGHAEWEVSAPLKTAADTFGDDEIPF